MSMSLMHRKHFHMFENLKDKAYQATIDDLLMSFKLTPEIYSLPTQVLTNRVCEWIDVMHLNVRHGRT